MASLPYIQLPQSQAPAIIGDIGDTLVNAARAKQEREQMAARNLLDQQRLAADQARMRAEESRAQAEEHRAAAAEARQQHLDEAQRAESVRGGLEAFQQHMMAGDQAGAEAIAQATPGMKATQRALATPDPGAAPASPQAPTQTADMSDASYDAQNLMRTPQQGPSDVMDQQQQQVQQQAAERDQYAQALADHPRLVAEHAQRLQAFQQAKQNPVYDIETPYGKSTFDLGAVRQHQQAQAQSESQAYPPQYQLRYAALRQASGDPQKADAAIQRAMQEDQHKQEMSDFHIPAAEQIRLKEAEIAARRHAAKAGGADGGAGLGANAAELAKRIAAGNNGQPLSQAEMISAATELGIPLEAKAGRVSLATIAKESRFNADNARKDASGQGGATADVNKWAITNGIDAIGKSQRELGALQKELTDNAHNPLQQALAVEKAVSAARGGAASRQALALALQHLGGSLDNAEGIISKIRSGELSPGQMKNFTDFVNGQLGAAQQQGKDAYDNYQKYVASLPPEKQRAAKAQVGRLFSGFHGFGGKGGGGDIAHHPSTAPIGEIRVRADGSKIRKVGPNQWEPVQ